MNIRPAAAADTPQILAIWNPVIAQSLLTFNNIEKTSDDIADMLASTQKHQRAFVVAEISGRVAGFAYYTQFRGGAGYAHTMEHTVYVAPESQGRGVGRALLSRVEGDARRGGAHLMFAAVSAQNPSGIMFHERAGYRETARLYEAGRKFDRWLDLVLLQKRL